jgi:Flagellar protein FliT
MDHPPDSTTLYRELLRLSEEMHAAARSFDGAMLDDLADRREVVISAIGKATPPADTEAMMAIIRRVLELDRELLDVLHARRDATRAELDETVSRRRSLQSYRGAPPTDPLFVERIG